MKKYCAVTVYDMVKVTLLNGSPRVNTNQYKYIMPSPSAEPDETCQLNHSKLVSGQKSHGHKSFPMEKYSTRS